MVTFAGQKKTAKADARDEWKLKLDPLKASVERRLLSVTASDGESLILNDILVDDVRAYCVTCGPGVAGCEPPSVIVTSRSAATFSNTSTPPPIQLTSMRSTRSCPANPKWSRVP